MKINNNISKNIHNNFLKIKTTRDYMRSEFNIRASMIPLDIIISVLDYQINLDRQLTMKRFLAESAHSPTGIRYHLQNLIDDELVYFVNSETDKRLRIIKAKPKLFEKIEEFNLININTL